MCQPDRVDHSAPTARPPIFGITADDPTVAAFESVEEAASYAEPWDVNDGLWKFWDSEGRVLVAPGPIDVTSSWTRLVATVDLEPDALRWALVRTLRLGEPDSEALDQLSLDDLGRLAMDRCQVQVPRWMEWQPLTWLRNRLR